LQTLQTLEKWFLYFVLYGAVGWVYETILCSVAQKKFVNRGLLHGPICPIYGVGAVAVLLLLSRWKNQPIVLFFLSAIVTTTVEYITSYILEKFAHMRLWDYSKRFFNLHGRVCLLGFTVFGLMSVLMVEYVHPWVESLPALLTPMGVHVASAAFLIWILTDLSLTLGLLLRLFNHLRALQKAVEQKLPELPLSRAGAVRRLIRAFPKLDFTKYQNEWQKIKEKTFF